MKRLVAGCAATAAVYVPLALYADSQVGPTTPSVVLMAGLTATALAGTMIASTRGWSLRGVGLFLFLAGTAVLLNGGYYAYRWDMAPQTGERLNDLVLALWIVGCPLALTGAALYWTGRDRVEGDDE